MTYRSLILILGAICALLMVLPLWAEPFDLSSDEFPIGMYSADNDGSMKQVKAMGIGYVHTYGMGSDTSPEALEKYRAYMDLAEKNGLKVMAYLNGRKWVDSHGLIEMHKIVMALKDHPALGFWLLYDEPSGKHSVRDLKPFYWLLKYETPDVPIAIVEAWTKDWWRYPEVCDILQLDNYPVRDEAFPGSPLGNVTEFVGRGVKLEGANIMPVAQCMNWKVMGDYIAKQVEDVNKLRYPTKTEILYWSYSSLAQGVRGLFWWSYYRSVQGGYGWINSEFKDAMLEVKQFTELASPAHKPEIFKYAADEDVYMAVWRRAGGNYLVVANGQPITKKIRRGTEGLIADGATLEPWGHTRTTEATVEGGQFTVSAEPWETFVWRFTEPEKTE